MDEISILIATDRVEVRYPSNTRVTQSNTKGKNCIIIYNNNNTVPPNYSVTSNTIDTRIPYVQRYEEAIRAIADGKNPVASVVAFGQITYGADLAPADYGRVGALVKTYGATEVCKALHNAMPYRPVGNVWSYVQRMLQGVPVIPEPDRDPYAEKAMSDEEYMAWKLSPEQVAYDEEWMSTLPELDEEDE